jgi:hypothetical protein
VKLQQIDILQELQAWYISQCDGDWEHGYGISITTLDNPGWSVSINVAKIVSEDYQEELLTADLSNEDWIFCKVESCRFVGRADPTKLLAILDMFLRWKDADKHR